MENSIRELIESATVNGSISDAEREYIIKKASEIGIDEIEVKIDKIDDRLDGHIDWHTHKDGMK